MCSEAIIAVVEQCSTSFLERNEDFSIVNIKHISQEHANQLDWPQLQPSSLDQILSREASNITVFLVSVLNQDSISFLIYQNQVNGSKRLGFCLKNMPYFWFEASFCFLFHGCCLLSRGCHNVKSGYICVCQTIQHKVGGDFLAEILRYGSSFEYLLKTQSLTALLH